LGRKTPEISRNFPAWEAGKIVVPLSKDQTLTVKKDGRELLEATEQDTSELHWWLLGFGSSAEVLEPEALRKEFRSIAKDMAKLYK
jgi:predicted DNA-binding transcriptional regulator YafY